jgi:hypothetical protein
MQVIVLSPQSLFFLTPHEFASSSLAFPRNSPLATRYCSSATSYRFFTNHGPRITIHDSRITDHGPALRLRTGLDFRSLLYQFLATWYL